MRAGWVFAAAVAIAACGKEAGKGEGKGEPAAPAIDPQTVKRFTGDFDKPLVGIGPEAPADKILAALKAALADAPEVGFVMLEAAPGDKRVAGKGEAGYKGYRLLCKLKAPPPPHPRDSIEDPPPTLSVLLAHDRVWLLVSRIKDSYMISVGPSLEDDVRKLAAQLASEEWFAEDRYAELAVEGGVTTPTLLALIQGMCASFASFRIVAPEALTSRPEL